MAHRPAVLLRNAVALVVVAGCDADAPSEVDTEVPVDTDVEAVDVVDAFGQACPSGGAVTLTYTVVHDGCFEEVTEDRCRAWWGDGEEGGDVSTWIQEVDRCVQRTQWFEEADYRSDPRVVDYGADTDCFADDPVPCDG